MKNTKKDLAYNMIDPGRIALFKSMIWNFYHQEGRKFPWRHSDDSYAVVVSEIMLQQTQTHRVIAKFEQFMNTFSNFNELAKASLRDVLSVWQGLGYNRRGMYLHQIAQKVIFEHGGQLPDNPEVLITFPGIGRATASSICAFAYNTPTVFIETNIRTVFIHFFFQNQAKIHDDDIMPLVAVSVDHDNPRHWYYALMDYGVMLKRMTINPSRKSVHHIKQSKFEGSDRQIRGAIIRELTRTSQASVEELLARMQKDEGRVKKIIAQLCSDGLLVQCGAWIKIA